MVELVDANHEVFPGQSKTVGDWMVELVDANHEVFPGQSKTVTCTIPAPAK